MRRSISSITIGKLKVLNNISLYDLGHINVLCGKNSSGKTTLLKTLEKHSIKNMEEVKVCYNGFTKELVAKLITRFHDVYRNQPQFRIQHIEETVKLHFSDFLDKNNLSITSSRAEEIAHKFQHYIDTNNLGHIGASTFELSRFIEYCSKGFNAKYIPPNRPLIATTPYESKNEYILLGRDLLNHIFELKNQEVGSRKRNLYERLKSAFRHITIYYDFDIILTQSNVILKYSNDNLNWHNADQCGLGLFQVFQIMAIVIISKEKIILLEEPENHLHPEIQRRLVNYIKSNEKIDKQFIISTHSNIFLNVLYTDKIFQLLMNEKIELKDNTSKATILQDLGYSVSDNLTADLIILTEGPSDKPVIEELIAKCPTINDFNIKTWALGGDIMSKQDLTVFTDSYNVLAIIDNDPKSSKARKGFVKLCEELSVKLTILERYSIENYFTLKSLKSVFGSQIQSSIVQIKPEVKLEDQIGLDCKKNNRKIAKHMNWEDVKDTDLGQFITSIGTEIGNSA